MTAQASQRECKKTRDCQFGLLSDRAAIHFRNDSTISRYDKRWAARHDPMGNRRERGCCQLFYSTARACAQRCRRADKPDPGL